MREVSDHGVSHLAQETKAVLKRLCGPLRLGLAGEHEFRLDRF
jgi:hypothetical protein